MKEEYFNKRFFDHIKKKCQKNKWYSFSVLINTDGKSVMIENAKLVKKKD